MPTFDPGGGVPLARPSAFIGIFRLHEDREPGAGRLEFMPNLRCLGIDYRKAADPPAARFRYTSDDPLGNPDDPKRFEQTYPFTAMGPGVVLPDDQLIVYQFVPGGDPVMLWHGYFQTPQADLGPRVESVTFTCAGGPIREWDTPFSGATMRDADNPTTISDQDTDIPARFNPEGHPNANADGDDSGTDPNKYPVFLGPHWPSNKILGSTIREWTLAMAAKYIIARGNKHQTYTSYPNLSTLDNLLKVVQPTAEGGTIDLTDATTFTRADIEVTDFEITGEVWPEALWRLLEPHGFSFTWILSPATEDSDDGLVLVGDPTWKLAIYDENDNSNLKTVSLQIAGDTLDPSQTNLGGMSLARDAGNLANEIALDAKPISVEASFVLGYGFTPDGVDVGAPDKFKDNNSGFVGDAVNKYRLLIYDELGEGHWNPNKKVFEDNTKGDLSQVLQFGADKRPYVHRYRPGTNQLHTEDELGVRMTAKLHVATDYPNMKIPSVWDGVNPEDWLEVTEGWQLLKDRLGVRFTGHDPNSWAISVPGIDAPVPPVSLNQFLGGKINMIEMCDPTSIVYKPPIFMLTCVIQADQDFEVTSKRRPTGTPTRFKITRRHDQRDRFQRRVISMFSFLSLHPDASDVYAEDDKDEAQVVADGIRRAREPAVFAGSLTIPRLTLAYGMGDKIGAINGRNVSLRSNIGASAGESPIFPSIVAISLELDGQQSTHLQLSDRRAEPPPKRRRRNDE